MFYELHEKVLQLETSGKRIIKLNVGHTALSTPRCAVTRAVEVLSGSKSAYGSSQGTKTLLEMAAEREEVSPDCICVGPGSKHLIYALLSILKRKGASVATPAPYWPAYPLMAKELDMPFVSVSTSLENDWALPTLPCDNTVGIILICNPGNPTSTCYTQSSLDDLVKKASAAEIPVILDEAYRDIAFTKIETIQGAIRVRSFSKEFNMEGFRLGYVVAPPSIIQEVIRFNQLTITCVPNFVQEAGCAVLKERSTLLKEHTRIWSERLSYLTNVMREIGFEFADPKAGMYIFATHSRIENGENFCMKLLDKGVAVAPGTGFGNFSNFIRISASEEIPVLKEAMETIKSTLKS